MSSLAAAAIVFVCLFGSAVVGTQLRKSLPQGHVVDESRKLLEVCLGIVGTMSGLVLGLLVASASTSYNAQRSELVDASSKIVLLDRVLAHYGPAANDARQSLRHSVEVAIARIWPREGTGSPTADLAREGGERLLDRVVDLAPKTDVQQTLKPQALGLVMSIAQIRWLMFEQAGSTISVPLLVLLVFWFSITFLGFGLFAPQNPTVLVGLALCAIAVSGAVFLMLEMYQPFQGLLQISSAPLREALTHVGR